MSLGQYAAILALVLAQVAAAPQAAAMSAPFIVYFEQGSSELDARALHLLVQAELARRSVDAVVILAGYTDRVGSVSDNQLLSRERAEAAREALIRLGTPASHLRVEAYGEARPLIETADGVSEGHNRRVELTFAPLSYLRNLEEKSK